MILDLDMIFAKRIPRVNDFGYWPASSENIANEPVVEAFTVTSLVSCQCSPIVCRERMDGISYHHLVLGAWWLIQWTD